MRRVMCVAALLGGCFASHGIGSDPGDRPVLRDDAGGRDPAGRDAGPSDELFDPDLAPECPIAEPIEPDLSAPYPFCQWRSPDGYLRYCPMDERSHGYLNWHANKGDSEYCSGGVECNSCVCSDTCRGDSDCPRPESGSARPECLTLPGGISQCFLTCDDFERCPNGMSCVDMLEFDHFVCAWVTHGDRCE